MFQTPILFLVFNRPEITVQTFRYIAQIKPQFLYIAADGPRKSNPEDRDRCAETRQKVLELIDWPCEVKTLFREENIGCKRAISEGISWFFNHVEAGIILEDDCVAAPSFFPYCEKMLREYKDHPQIGMIGGANFLNTNQLEDSYFFSRYFIIWGWATWKNKWLLYQNELKDWPKLREEKWLTTIFKNKNTIRYYTFTFDKAEKNEVDNWDTHWGYYLFYHNQLAITPTKNLISNIGFQGTHTTKSHFYLFNRSLETYAVERIINPDEIRVSEALDDEQFYNVKISRFSLKAFVRVFLKDSFLLSIVYKIYRMKKRLHT